MKKKPTNQRGWGHLILQWGKECVLLIRGMNLIKSCCIKSPCNKNLVLLAEKRVLPLVHVWFYNVHNYLKIKTLWHPSHLAYGWLSLIWVAGKLICLVYSRKNASEEWKQGVVRLQAAGTGEQQCLNRESHVISLLILLPIQRWKSYTTWLELFGNKHNKAMK